MLLAALLPTGTLLAPPPAHALPQADDAMLVELTGLDPPNPQPGGTVTVTGTVTNRTGETIDDVTVALRVSGEPLGSRYDVSAVTDLTTTRTGAAVSGTSTEVTDALAPSAVAPFSVTVAIDDVGLGSNGVYAWFVEAQAPSVGEFDTAIPVPWFPELGAITPSRIVVLTPVRYPVDLTALNQLQSSQLTAQMAPGGLLHGWTAGSETAAAAGVPVSWLIDPAVVDAASRLDSGTASFSAEVTDPGAARETVAGWLETVTKGTAAPTSRVYATPYAEVDASAVLAAGMGSLLDQAISTAPTAAAQSLPRVDGLVAALPGGTTTSEALLGYAERSVTTALFRSTALPPTQRISYTPSGISDVPLASGQSVRGVIPDATLAAGLRRPANTAAERFRLQQGLLADAAMITLELPTTSRTVVMLPPEGLAISADVYGGVLTALGQAPYTQLVDLAALFGPDVPQVTRDLRLDQADSDRLTDEYLAPIPSIEQRLTTFSRVTVDPLAFEDDYRTAMLRSSSANWRDDVDAGQALLSSVEADLAAEEKKVTTVSTGTVQFTGSEGNLPLTISNELDQAVEVGVILQGEPQVRLTFTSPGLVVVDAGKRVSIEIPVQLYGSGPLPVTVILTDRDGRPFIETGDLVIQSAATSLIAAAVAIIGGVTFVVLVLMRFRSKGRADDDQQA